MNTLDINGKRLAYARTGQGTPLMLVHGFPLEHTIWEPMLPFLTDEFDVILPDLPGFGGSDALEPAPNMDAYAAALAGLLDALSLPHVILVGHSMGGYVALAFARLYPQRLLGLGLVASQALADPPDRKAGRYQTAEQVAAQGVGVVAEAMSPKLSADQAHGPVLNALILGQKPDGVISVLKAMAERPDSSPLLASFDFPVALVHGLQDVLIPPERAREIAAVAKRASLLELPGVGHMPMMEAPQETAKALKRLVS